MSTVSVAARFGGTGRTYSDNGETSDSDMRLPDGFGFARNLFPMLGEIMAALNIGLDAVESALTAPGTMATSVTAMTIALGVQNFTIEAGKAISKGQRLVVASTANPKKQMTGICESYNSATGATQATMDYLGDGAGENFAAWTVSLGGKPGSAGLVGRTAISGATTLTATHKCQAIDITAGTFVLAFGAAAVLGNGWWCFVSNRGAGDVTIDPFGTETCDGVGSFVMYPNASRLFYVDGGALYSILLTGGTKVMTSTADFVWAPGINQWDSDVTGGGAGAGSGARAASRFNGGGAGAAERFRRRIHKSEIVVGGSTTCTVGAKGLGGAAPGADNTNGNDGTDGGNSSIGTLAVAVGGKAGKGATTAAHGDGGRGGGKGLTYSAASGQNYLAPGQAYVAAAQAAAAQVPGDTEWGGPGGRTGLDANATGVQATLGGQRAGKGGAAVAAGTAGANAVNPGDGGDGGGGNVNGSAAGKGGDGGNGRIIITEVV